MFVNVLVPVFVTNSTLGHKGSIARVSRILGYTPLIHLKTTFNGLMTSVSKTVKCSVWSFGKIFLVLSSLIISQSVINSVTPVFTLLLDKSAKLGYFKLNN